jgi:hypothetical protein
MRLFVMLKQESRTYYLWWTVMLAYAVVACFPSLAAARFAARFSMAAGEEYNDNIQFSQNKKHDFVTVLTPALHFLYYPEFRPNALFTADLNAPAEIFARHSELTNIGDRFSLRSQFYYPYSSQLQFTLTECVSRIGQTRLGAGAASRRGGGNFYPGQAFGGFGGRGASFPGGVTRWGGYGGFGRSSGGGCLGGVGLDGLNQSTPGSVLSTNELITGGEALSNEASAYSSLSYSPNISFTGRYRWRYRAYLDAGGKEDSHEVEVKGTYHLWPQHNLTLRYRIEFLRTRTGKRETIHDFDFGDDFYSVRQINLTPTLSILASTGFSIGTSQGFRLRHTLDVALLKIWRTAIFSTGVRRYLGGSFGVAGISYTTDVFSQFTIQMSRRWTGFASAGYSIHEVQGPDFDTFQAVAGVQYWLTSWMSANLLYNYRRLDPGDSGSRQSDILRASVTDGNSVVLSVSAYFDIWPTVGLARGVAANAQILSAPALGTGPPQAVPGQQPGPPPDPKP